ncbi:MAG: DUF1636 domain-containing protein [Rhodobacteraceae bacterium]|nr:DUF1636 domain-containing protein [Paracoccaceae bacterium]
MVCTKCRLRGAPAPEGDRPGALLYDALTQTDLPAGVTLTPVECLSNCERGATVALRGGAARWTYVYGNLDSAENLEDILEGAEKYAATADGVVPWRDRPQHFRKNCIARIPPLEPANEHA